MRIDIEQIFPGDKVDIVLDPGYRKLVVENSGSGIEATLYIWDPELKVWNTQPVSLG